MNNGVADSLCAKCALRRISFTILLQGVKIEQVTKQFQGKYLDNFKKLIINEINKYYSKGLKSIESATVNSYKHESLTIELVFSVNPKYNQQIHTAVRRALVSINVSLFLVSINIL